MEILSTQEFRNKLNNANEDEKVDFGQTIIDDFMKMDESKSPEPPVISIDEDATSLDSTTTNTSSGRPLSQMIDEYNQILHRLEQVVNNRGLTDPPHHMSIG